MRGEDKEERRSGWESTVVDGAVESPARCHASMYGLGDFIGMCVFRDRGMYSSYYTKEDVD